MNEKKHPKLSDMNNSEILPGMLGENDLIQVIESVRASAFVMKEISRKNTEIKKISDDTVESLQSMLSAERQKTNDLHVQVNKITEQLNDITISSLEQRSNYNEAIQQLKASNAELTEKNYYLLEELNKAHAWLKLIYSTAANELKSTLDELENTNQVNLDNFKNNADSQ